MFRSMISAYFRLSDRTTNKIWEYLVVLVYSVTALFASFLLDKFGT
jgi:hypothetical protein